LFGQDIIIKVLKIFVTSEWMWGPLSWIRVDQSISTT